MGPSDPRQDRTPLAGHFKATRLGRLTRLQRGARVNGPSREEGEAMVVVVFKIQHRPELPVAEYDKAGARMLDLVSQMPGFLGMDYAEIEGGELLVVRFESHEALEAWRTHPEHQETQR